MCARFLSEMSAEGQHRFEVNPLRMLDTKDPNDLRLLARRAETDRLSGRRRAATTSTNCRRI